MDLSKMQLDALSELGNISTGNAATSLSKFLSKNVDMNIPETKFVPISDFAAEVGGPEQVMSGIYLHISGELEGEALFLFSRNGALEIVDILMGRTPGEKAEMDEMDLSAFKELSNVLTGTFLTSIATMLDIKLMPSTPHVATDMAQSLLDFILIQISEHADDVLCIKTKINLEGHNLDGDFLVIFDKPSLERVLRLLEQRYGAI